MNPATLVRVHRVSPGDSGSVLVEYEAGRATDAAGVVMNLAGATGSGVGGPTASRCTQRPVVDVTLAPTDDVQEGGDEPPELEVVTAGEDVTL
jgi:hypothetical protein